VLRPLTIGGVGQLSGLPRDDLRDHRLMPTHKNAIGRPQPDNEHHGNGDNHTEHGHHHHGGDPALVTDRHSLGKKTQRALAHAGRRIPGYARRLRPARRLRRPLATTSFCRDYVVEVLIQGRLAMFIEHRGPKLAQ
jgi:hypothetical protein